MALIVQKYGGSSVKDVDRIKNVASKIKRTVDQGNQVVVVVSARGGVTNDLIARAKAINPNPNEKEMDTLLATGEQETIALTAMALHSMGVKAASRTGAGAGITTDSFHTKARITDITGGDIPQLLKEGNVVIVAGFQGVTKDGFLTTLGRGGSDLSAIALAAALKADLCEIYTDVDGVYTADPRIIKNAKKLNEICYEELLEMASSGAKVMQARSVEFAQKFGVVFEVKSSFNNERGTIVREEVKSMEDVMVSGLAVDKDQTKVTVSNLADKPGAAAQIFKALGENAIIVDMIVQNIARDGVANLTFTVAKDDAQKAKSVVENICNNLGTGVVDLTGDIAKISVVGVGMRSHSGVAAKFFDCLAKIGANIELISTSEIKISVAISTHQANDAANIIHEAFDLAK